MSLPSLLPSSFPSCLPSFLSSFLASFLPYFLPVCGISFALPSWVSDTLTELAVGGGASRGHVVAGPGAMLCSLDVAVGEGAGSKCLPHTESGQHVWVSGWLFCWVGRSVLGLSCFSEFVWLAGCVLLFGCVAGLRGMSGYSTSSFALPSSKGFLRPFKGLLKAFSSDL